MQYSVRFIGHVKEPRLIGWPETVEFSAIYQASSMEEFEEWMNAMGTRLKIEQGITATNCNLPGQEKSDVEFGNGKFVPNHMLTHISYSVRKLAGDMPTQKPEKGDLN
jgi:hypothetical protein